MLSAFRSSIVFGMTDDEMRKQTREIIGAVEAHNDADVFAYLGPVSLKSEREFNDCLKKGKRRDNVLCLIATYGGSADVAYQLARAAKRHYPNGKFILFVDSICKSAGTLLAIGADEIVMSDTAELGPLDIQLQKPEELGELMSGLTSTQALNTLQDAAFETFETTFLRLRFRSQLAISTRTAAEVAVKLAVGLFDPIYAHFDPMRLGEHERSNQIALAYGDRIKTGNVKDDTIRQLIAEYPSHGFVIDRDEAQKLFHSVRAPEEAEVRLGMIFRKASEQALEGDSPIIRRLNSDDKESDAAENENGTDSGTARQNGESHFESDKPTTDANGPATGDNGAPEEAVGGSPN